MPHILEIFTAFSIGHKIMWGTVIFIGLPAGLYFRNITALMLSIAWLIPEFNWLITGDSYPLWLFICADISVMGVIFAKAISNVGDKLYLTSRSRLKGFISDLTFWDGCILGLFLLGAWPIYIINIHEYYRYWYLLYISVTQFLLAGAEAIQLFIRSFRASSASHPADNSLVFAGRIGGYA